MKKMISTVFVCALVVSNVTIVSGGDLSFQRPIPDSIPVMISLRDVIFDHVPIEVSAGAEKNEADKVPSVVMEIIAPHDHLVVDKIICVPVGGVADAGSITTEYVFDGNTEFDNAAFYKGEAIFTDLGLMVPRGSTKTMTLKVDIRNASSRSVTFSNCVVAVCVRRVRDGAYITLNTIFHRAGRTILLPEGVSLPEDLLE